MNYFKTFALLVFMAGLLMVLGYLIGGESGVAIALVISILMNFGTWFFSDKIVLSMYHAKEVTESSHPNYYRMVKNLAETAGLPMPKVYVIPSNVPNAFATGRDPKHAAVAATEGIMNTLTYPELEGVMAHELAHVKNHDSLVMTIAATVASAIMFLSRFIMFFGGGRSSRDNPLGLIGLLAWMILAPIAAILIKLAISRTREYEADRIGAEICGKPLNLASALNKLSAYNGHPDSDLSDNSTSHLWIVNPLSAEGLAGLFSTHPPMKERIRRLEKMAGIF